MTSHEHALKLRELADFLLSRPAFKAPSDPMILQSFYVKEDFLQAVKSIGSVTKKYTDGSFAELQCTSTTHPEILLYIPRDKVCRKVQDVVWECEPMLTAEEDSTVGV